MTDAESYTTDSPNTGFTRLVRTFHPVEWMPENAARQTNWLLRFGVLIYMIGLTASIFQWSGSSIGGIALMEWGVPAEQILIAERIGIVVLMLAALSLLIYPNTTLLLLFGIVIFAESYAMARFGGIPHAELTPLAHALRYLLPVGLMPLVVSEKLFPWKRWRLPVTSWILRIGLATVFIIHGLEALWHKASFIDLILGSAWNLAGLTLSESTATTALTVIGTVDIIVALLVLIRPWRAVLAYMCFWALVTAFARPTALGLVAYPEVLLRASHYLTPIAVWWLIHGTKGSK